MLKRKYDNFGNVVKDMCVEINEFKGKFFFIDFHRKQFFMVIFTPDYITVLWLYAENI